MFNESDLEAAVAAGVIDGALRERLLDFAATRRLAMPATAPAARFDPIHVLYYAGALIVITAMGLFATTAFAALGGWSLFAVAVAYAAGLGTLGDRLWRKPETRIPAGLLIAAAVSMAPLAIYGVQDGLGLWAAGKPGGYNNFYPLINGSWVYMELGAVAASVLALRRYPFPFIVLIAAFAAWFLSMDLAALVFYGRQMDGDTQDALRRNVSEAVGVVMIVAAWTLDLKGRRLADFGFWMHLFGALTLWGALTAGDGSEFGKTLYGLFNVVFIAFGLFLGRRVYAVFGTIGIALYLGHLAYHVFNDTLGFTFALTAIGLAIVGAGVALERRRAVLAGFLDSVLPGSLRALRPQWDQA